MLMDVFSNFLAWELTIDTFQNNKVHASGKWSSTTGAPPRTVDLEEIKSRLTPIDSRGVYPLCVLV